MSTASEVQLFCEEVHTSNDASCDGHQWIARPSGFIVHHDINATHCDAVRDVDTLEHEKQWLQVCRGCGVVIQGATET